MVDSGALTLSVEGVEALNPRAVVDRLLGGDGAWEKARGVAQI